MAEDKKAPENQEPKDDGLGNLKSEMNRKFSNFDERLAQVAQLNQQILEQLKNPTVPAKPAPRVEDEADTLIYDNPKAFVTKIKQEAKQEVLAEVQAQQARVSQFQDKQNQVLNQLVQDYPELSNMSHPLTQRTVKIYQSLAEEDKKNPIAYRMAALEAAAEMGLSPKSKRESNDSDDFTLGGSNQPPKRKGKTSKDDEAMLEFASLMGVDVSKKETVERLQGRRDRTWNQYK
jgi:hypothetical protein